MTPVEIRALIEDDETPTACAEALELLLPIVEELAEVTLSGRVVMLIMRAREALK